MDSKYKTGKIYKIVDNGYNMCYYGSTTQKLCSRLSGHRRTYRAFLKGTHRINVSVFEIFEKYGEGNCKIELVELCPSGSKAELLSREGFFIKNNECVNKVVAGRKAQEYYVDNKEKITKRIHDYNANNKDEINLKQRSYYSSNKIEIREKMSMPHNCDCGGKYQTTHKAHHMKTKLHQSYLQEIQKIKIL